MASTYKPSKIEKKWQQYWEENKMYQADDSAEKKFYLLVEFPYPSGNLHVGHWYAFSVPDIFARAKRMQGWNVLYPIGFDAFGLPAENAAIKRNLSPKKWTYDNMDCMRKQIRSMGASFDRSRDVVTCDPEYYKWTQWLFLQLFKNDLVEQRETLVNWCPSCKTVLANEQVVNAVCERCSTSVEQKTMKQWQIKITKYADRLIDDLDELAWPEEIKQSQRNWIGRSEGAIVKFKVQSPKSKVEDEFLEVFTTRVDTIYGCTYIVVAPEHSLVTSHKSQVTNYDEVEKYIESVKKKDEQERTDATKEKTGVELKGLKAINPFNGEEVPIFVADYVLGNYGTGAVMAVPAHDERDFAFAKKYDLPTKQSIAPAFFRTDPKDPNVVQPDKPTIRRKTIKAIVEHWEGGKFYALKWKNGLWNSSVIGGVEDGESSQDAAIREVKEETGYQNIGEIREICFSTHANFYAEHKGVNRYSEDRHFYVKLAGEEFVQPNGEETKNHEGMWLDREEFGKFLNLPDNLFAWNILQNGEKAFTEDGIVIDSDKFSNLTSAEAREKMIEWLEKTGNGKRTKQYRLRDWTVSRQRYWGSPIPIVHCAKCGAVAVQDEQLPVVLPELDNYLPREDGKSPLAKAEDWVKTTCPECGGEAERETDTLDTFVCSSWYFLRYTDPHNSDVFADSEKLKKWLMVDRYSGGAEHTTMHVLYSRFFYKALFDLGLVPTREPYTLRMNRSIILGPDGNKMSKSKGNVIDPDDVVREFGADALRLYLAFIGPYNKMGSYPWNTESLSGMRRFLDKVWRLQSKVNPSTSSGQASENIQRLLHKTIKKVTQDIEEFKFNTAISQLMVLVNALEKEERVDGEIFKTLLILLSPFAPHIAEEIWQSFLPCQGEVSKAEGLSNNSIFLSAWPTYDEDLVKDDVVTIMVQVNGKVRGQFEAATDIAEDNAREQALAIENVQKFIDGKEVRKVIFVPGRLVNIVV